MSKKKMRMKKETVHCTVCGNNAANRLIMKAEGFNVIVDQCIFVVCSKHIDHLKMKLTKNLEARGGKVLEFKVEPLGLIRTENPIFYQKEGFSVNKIREELTKMQNKSK